MEGWREGGVLLVISCSASNAAGLRETNIDGAVEREKGGWITMIKLHVNL